MSWFRKVLAVIAYAGTAAAPLLASTGVGAPVAISLAGLGVASGAVLHFLDSPRTPADVIETAKVLVAQGKALKVAVDDAKKTP